METKKKIELEFRDDFYGKTHTFRNGDAVIMITPPIDEDYWTFRIKLYKDQALLAFPKFGTMGIGFAIEKDWNTNLPYCCSAENIYKHIKCNKKYKEITKKTCIEAIEILQNACDYYMNNERPEEERMGSAEEMKFYIENLMKIVSQNNSNYVD